MSMADFDMDELTERLANSDNHQENYIVWRDVLRKVIINKISNPSNIIDHGSDGTGAGNLTVALELLHHIIQVCPRAFHVPKQASKQQDVQEETADSLGLNRLLIGRLLSVAGHEDCGIELRNRIVTEVSFLLRTICSRDPYIFTRIVTELIYTLADLVGISEQFYNTETEETKAGLYVKRFLIKGESPPIKLQNEDACEMLQITITSILAPIGLSVCQFAHSVSMFTGHSSLCLFATLGCQIELGEIELKTVSLELGSVLLEHGGLPAGQPLDYFVHMLIALLDLLAGGFNEIEGNYERLERALLDCLRAAVDAACRPGLEVEEATRHDVLSTLLTGISQAIIRDGMMALSTDTLRTGLGQLITTLYIELPGCVLHGQVMRHRRQELASRLLQEAGQSMHLQYMIGVLQQCVWLETCPYSTLPCSTEVGGGGSGDASLVVVETTTTTGRKRKLSTSTSSSSGSQKTVVAGAVQGDALPLYPESVLSEDDSPSIAVLITDRLEELMHKLQEKVGRKSSEDSVENVLEGIRVLLEVLAWCQIFCTSASTQHGAGSGLLHPGGGASSASSTSSTKSQLVMSQYMSTEILQTLSTVWITVLEQYPALYIIIVQSIGSLLSVQDLWWKQLSVDMVQNVTCILSLHWMPNEVSWLDLKSLDHPYISKLSQDLAEKLSCEAIGECVHVMAHLPKDIACKWRTRVLQMALGDSREAIRAAAIQSFPFFLYHSGPNANHLVHDQIHGCLGDKSGRVEQALADTMGAIACVVSRKATLHRKALPSDDGGPMYRSITVHCVVCDDHHDDSQPTSDNGCHSNQIDRPKMAAANMFQPFLSLLGAENKDVRLSSVRELRRVFSHVSVRAGNAVSVKMLQTCLTMLKDPQHDIRMAFSDVIAYVAGFHGNDTVTDTEKMVIKSLANMSKDAKKADNKPRLLEAVLLAIGELARACEGELLMLMLYPLVDGVCSPSCPLEAAVCNTQLRLITRHKHYRPRLLFVKFAKDLCQRIVDQLHECQRKRTRDPLLIITEIVDAFEFEDVKGFLRRFENLILPPLVKKASPAASALLQTFAKQLGDPNHKGPLARNIQHIYCHLVLSCEEDELIKTFDFLKKESSWDLKELLKVGLNIDHELILHLHTHYDKVLKGLKFLCLHLGTLGSGKTDYEDITEEDIVTLLKDKLLGILVHFDNFLNNESIPIRSKRDVFASLMSLMRLMGPATITQVRLRLMTTLKIGLRFKDRDFQELCCKAWGCFVHSVEAPALGGMLSQIVVNLLPLLHHLHAQVAEIFNFLIVQNRRHLSDHFHELYFMPELPELADVNEVLRSVMEESAYSKNVKTQLRLLVKGASHESSDVRQLALTKLRTLLHQHQHTLHQLVLSSENVDPCISEIASALIAGCRESDQTMRALFGQCLGQLGAIDPGRLEVCNGSREEKATFYDTVNSHNFAFALINLLADTFLRAEDRTSQDCVAFAIQELIIKYKVSNDPGLTSHGTVLWARFNDGVKEILTPLMHSKYVLTTKLDWSQTKRPIYTSKKCKSFHYWVSTLTAYLASKVEDVEANKVFGVCQAVVKNHSDVALYMLPYVVVHMLLHGNKEHREELVQEILTVLHDVERSDSRAPEGTSDLRGHMSAQTVFSVLDHCTQWRQHRITGLVIAATRQKQPKPVTEAVYKKDLCYRNMEAFLSEIPQDLLSVASFKCGAYTRALMHYELHIASATPRGADCSGDSTPPLTQEQVDFFQKLYVALDEPDGVAGITSIKSGTATLQEQILHYESTGQMFDASVCYDLAAQQEPDCLQHRMGLLSCRLALGELTSARDLAHSMIQQRPDWSCSLNAYRVEAAWKLGQWEELEAYLQPEEQSRNWNIGLGKILLALKDRNDEDFSKQLCSVRNELMGPLSAASMEVGSYQRGYQHIVRLQMLNEVEEGARTLLNFPTSLSGTDSMEEKQVDNFSTFLQHWRSRLNFTQSSFRTQEPILNLRRILLTLAQETGCCKEDSLKTEIGRCWLQTAQISRQCGFVQTAHSSLLRAEQYNLPDFCLEQTKWLWERGTYDKAQTYLEKALESEYPDRVKIADGSVTVSNHRRKACAQAVLLLGKYYEETASQEANIIMAQYKQVLRVHSEWEDGYFHLAKYYDKIMLRQHPELFCRKGDLVHQIIKNFGESLRYGSKFIYQSMPRMLAVWLDYGQAIMEPDPAANDVVRQSMRASVHLNNKTMAAIVDRVASYQFLTAFPQLVSRICHPHTEVFRHLLEIVAKLLHEFPQQAVWMMMAISKSTYQARAKRCIEIFNRAKTLNPDLHKFLQDAIKLTDRLVDLCNRQHPENTMSISTHFKPLQRLVDDSKFSKILVPLQKLMTVTLPSDASTTEVGGSDVNPDPSAHDPFPGQQIFIRGFDDTVDVLQSLQKPKKVTLRGSDGKGYVMLCKPKDDLRKDARLMEFNGVVNKCLKKDPESRRRDLHIRTYTVTPISEECGLLEWVSNTTGLRHVLLKLLKERGLGLSSKELKASMLPSNTDLQKKLDVFRNKLLPNYPPVFGEWFLRTFPDPTSWYNARLNYCRTAAVMSMVGYILGLGDRHGENILFDSTNGASVHVDFNCLFNKGDTFDYPEVVPFRLSHNMVSAMGPMGYEGVFRRTCEVTLRVMRNQSDPLMSVLKTFIYDPLCEWSKPAPKGRSNHAAESGQVKNEQAEKHVKLIEARLKGILKSKSSKTHGLPLSVEGQANHLIKEATDENNLCQMYIGWAPYL